MFASAYGHTNIVQLLLDHDADNNLQNKVSSSTNNVCVCLPHCCAPGMLHNYLALCGCTTEVNSQVHKLSVLPYQWSLLSVA